VLNADKSKLETRLNFDTNVLPVMFKSGITINQTENVMGYGLHQSSSTLIVDYKHIKWRNYITLDIERLINHGSMAITPVKIGQKAIGVITSHSFEKSRPITAKDFSELDFLFDHLNLYLSVLNSKR
jgi:hypothetical protein